MDHHHRFPLARRQLWAKACVDRLFAMVLLVLLAPFFALIAVAIRLDDGGPVLFRQDRAGKDGKLFTILKFRTMVPNADRLLDASGATTGDPRVTRVGSVLRWLSVDELPQLMNILRGEMSFVGPRPVLPSHLQRYDARQKQRFAVRPGITGLAQVRGRNTLPWTQRLEADVDYVRSFSLWLDLVILLHTVRAVVLREGFVMDRNPEDVDDLPRPGLDGTDPT